MSSTSAAAEAPTKTLELPEEMVLHVPMWRQRVMRVVATYFRLFHAISFIGAENMPAEGPVLVVSNHPTYFDPIIIGMGFERWVNWLAWDEIFGWPVVGRWTHELGAIPVNLERPGANILKGALKVLRAGNPLGVFFEGGRSETPLLNTPLPGAASIALRTGTPILPVTITGAHRCWPQGRMIPRPGRIVVVYHPVIPVEVNRRRDRDAELALTEQLREVIRWPLDPAGGPFRVARAFAAARGNP